RVESLEELVALAQRLLGSRLVTPQTGARGLPVNALRVEQALTVSREMYLGVLIDRGRERVTFMAAAQGGVDIERIAAAQPGAILAAAVDPVVGLQPYQCRRIAFGLGLAGSQADALGRIMQSLYRLFVERDASIVEINPLVITAAGELLALDAKVAIDDNALYRQRALAEWRDPSQEDEKELAAARFGLNYITLDGDIACMVNGAGLAMATMDLIKLHGGEPANFLDVGGGTTADKVAEAFKLILSDPKVKAILVNIFGGIVRCDLIAEGIIKAVREVSVTVPVVVRLEGTRAERGRELLRESGLALVTAGDLTDAATKAVAAARGGEP
ncbi:MAG: ADP-forming succinate--CoA ligase subunit beta, partial [Gammaproteobacteria bacterium]|nr:ADP-forming succinate--CoA ligase subunit beta [Gammaproteobacteria bacterium]